MSVPVDLDPVEVLEHLKAIGYHHITKDQLKQFIKDLKKLIKHDLRKLEQNVENNRSEIWVKSGAQEKVAEDVRENSRKILGERNQPEKPYESRQLKSTAVQTVVPCRDLVVTPSTNCERGPTTTQRCASSSQSDYSSSKCGATCKTGKCSCSEKPSKKRTDQTSRPKPVSSFIRIPPAKSRGAKTDPVTLYHYYQSLWARQSRPGENSHADVRWRIRHKMMAPVNVKSCPEIRRENPPWVD